MQFQRTCNQNNHTKETDNGADTALPSGQEAHECLRLGSSTLFHIAGKFCCLIAPEQLQQSKNKVCCYSPPPSWRKPHRGGFGEENPSPCLPGWKTCWAQRSPCSHTAPTSQLLRAFQGGRASPGGATQSRGASDPTLPPQTNQSLLPRHPTPLPGPWHWLISARALPESAAASCSQAGTDPGSLQWGLPDNSDLSWRYLKDDALNLGVELMFLKSFPTLTLPWFYKPSHEAEALL